MFKSFYAEQHKSLIIIRGIHGVRMYSVLYVDDEPGLLEIGKLFLEGAGDFSVETAVSAHAALELMKETRFDAIISDYQMPGMDGIALLKMVRSADSVSPPNQAHPRIPELPQRRRATPGDTPFILFTGRGREEVVIEAINSGVDFYVQKGGEPKSQFIELGHKIRQAIRRKNAEDALAINEERLRFALEGANDGLWDVTLATGQVYLSPRGCEILGYTFADLPHIARIWSDLVHPQDLPATQFELAKYMAGEAAVFEVEQRLRMKSGDWKWVLARGKIVERDTAGNPVRMTGTHTDITRRKKTEDDLIRAKKDWEAIFRAIGNHLVILDKENRILEVNDTVVKKTGKPAEELKGMKCWQVFHGPDVSGPPDCCPYAQLKRSGSLETTEMELEALGGFYLVSCTPILNDAGQLDRVIHIAVDVTDKKLNERELSRKNQELQASYEQMAASDEELRQTIDDLGRSEQALRKSEGKYRSVIESIPVGMLFYQLEPDGKLIFTGANPAADTILRIPLDTLKGKTIEEAFPRLAATDIPDQYRKVSRDGSVWHTEQVDYDYEQVRGAYSVWAFQITPDQMAAAFLDITEIKRAQQALAASERAYRTILDNIQDVFYRTDARGDLIMVSPSGPALLGYPSADPVLGRPATDFYAYPEDREQFLEEIRKNGMVDQMEVTLKRMDGTTVMVSTSSHRYFDDEGNFAGVEGIFRDITRLKKTQERLHESAEKYRTLVRHIQDGVFLMQDGLIVFCNPVYAEMVGYSPEEMPGIPIPTLIAPEDRERVMENYRNRLSGNTVPADYEFHMLHKDKTTRVPVRMSVGIGMYRGKKASIGTVRKISPDS